MPPNRWVGSTSGGICPSLRSGFPWASFYSLSEPTAWPPALRAESEIPPPAFGRPPPFLKGGLGATDPKPTQGGNVSPEPATTSGGLGRGGPRRHTISFALRAAEIEIPPEGRGAHGGTGPSVRADLPRRGGPSAEGPRPLLPGRSLSLSLGRESEARGRAATGVIYKK